MVLLAILAVGLLHTNAQRDADTALWTRWAAAERGVAAAWREYETAGTLDGKLAALQRCRAAAESLDVQTGSMFADAALYQALCRWQEARVGQAGAYVAAHKWEGGWDEAKLWDERVRRTGAALAEVSRRYRRD